MNMNEVIARINELAKKNKTEGLTEEELAQFDAFHSSALVRLREKPLYFNVIYRYIYAVY